MKRHQGYVFGVAVCGLLTFTGLVAAQESSANRMMNNMDSTFSTKAAQGGMAEVQMAQLAEQKTSSPAVKEFARRMITDHTRLNNDLQQIAAKQNMTLPTAMDAKDQQMYNHLEKLSGAQFDKEYMPAQVSAHHEAIALFEREAQHGTDAQLKSFASNALPTLNEHLKLAQATEAKVKNE